MSLAVADLGWHFYNFHYRGFCDETQWGLRELEAAEAGDIFEAARGLVESRWDEIGSLEATGGEAFAEGCADSGIERELYPLNQRRWAICEKFPSHGLLHFWLDYTQIPSETGGGPVSAKSPIKSTEPTGASGSGQCEAAGQ